RAREIHVLEGARDEARGLRALAGVELAVAGDEDRLAGGEVADDLVAAVLEDEGFARDDPLVADLVVLTVAEDEGANAEGVAEGEEAVAADEGDRRVGALDALMKRLDRVEHL